MGQQDLEFKLGVGSHAIITVLGKLRQEDGKGRRPTWDTK